MSSNKYDLVITDTDGDSTGFVFDYVSGQPGVVSEPIDVQAVTSSNPTQAGGPYDTSSASDYKRIAVGSFHSGAAQESYDTEDASPSKFWESLNVDISEKGILKLGPGTTSYTTSPTTIQGVTAAGLNVVWQSFDPVATTTTALRYSTDNVTWTAVTFTGTDPTGAVLALACDGEYMYCSFAGSGNSNGIWRGKASATAWTQYADVSTDEAQDVQALCHCGGYLYGTKGDSATPTASSLAYIDGTTKWTTGTPNGTLSGANVVQGVDTVGLVSIGPFVYWVTYGGSVTKIYAAQKGATTEEDFFQQVAEFPRGFIGECAHAYLGTLYVGGEYESYTASRGVGAIYLFNNETQSLLTMIGEDPEEDWRVLFLNGYEKHLYFVAANSIYKWSLEHGGYSHVSAVSGGTTPSSAISWDVEESMAAEPTTGWTKTETGTCSETISGGALVLTTDAVNEAVRYTRTSVDGDMASATGWTLEFQVPSGVASGSGTIECQLCHIYAADDTNTVYVTGSTDTAGTSMRFQLVSGATVVNTSYYSLSSTITVRLTAKSGVGKLYVNNVLSATGTLLASGTATKYSFGFYVNVSGATEVMAFDYFRFYNGGAVDPGAGVSTSSGNLACLRDELWVSATDTGIYKTNSAENTSGYMTCSRSASHMQTVPKFYRAIEATTDQPLSGDQTIKAEWAIDGEWGGGTTLDVDTSTGTKHAWTLNQTGQDIRPKFTIGKTTSLGPRVTGWAVKYLLPNIKRHTFFLNCTDSVQMKNGQKWDEDASAAIDTLFSLTDAYVSIDAPWDSDIGAKIESVEFVDFQRRPKPNNTYQGLIKLVCRELE